MPYAKNYSLEINIPIGQWVDNLASKGRHSFSLNEVKSTFTNDIEAAIKLKLTRLAGKRKIMSIHKGYYLIITPQYAPKGVLPPALFIDGLMKFLKRPFTSQKLKTFWFYGRFYKLRKCGNLLSSSKQWRYHQRKPGK